MNNLIIPPSPNWYESKILSCTIDNTIVYGSRNEIVVIKPTSVDQPADIRLITLAHYERIASVDTNPTWGKPDKLLVSAADDKIVKLWDLEKFECRGSHNTHTTNADKLVGACFAGSDRVVSVSENGFVTIWRIGNNEVVPLKGLFNFKVQITCVSSCPHASWLIAFGLKCGLVVIADLRKSGKILYKLRGHDKNVVSLTWCPTPFNVFPKNFPNKNRKILHMTKADSADSAKEMNLSSHSDSETFCKQTKQVAEDLKVQPEVTVKKSNPWINLKHADDDDEIESNPFLAENSTDEATPTDSNDFLSECEALKQKILVAKRQTLLPRPQTEREKYDPKTTAVTGVNTYEVTERCDIGATEIAVVHESYAQMIDADIANEKCSDSLFDDASTSNELPNFQPDINTNLCKSENIVDLISDSELDNEIQEIFQPTKEYLLASSARGGSIYIWRAGTDGRIQRELPLSGKPNRKHYRSGEKGWITLCWITPEILLSSSSSGELLQWDLLNTNDKTNVPQKKLIHHDHGSNLFCIAAPTHMFHVWEEENWRDRKDLYAWTIGQDRFLLCTSLLADRITLSSYPTIGGHIYCLTSSPLDPCRIAVGIGDSTAKVWDLSRPHLQCIIMTHLWQKMQSKVVTLAWHPSKEMLLAYGTFEGRIGITNTNNTSKLPVLLCQYFRSAVHKIEWGPSKGNAEDIGLYACGEGKLVLYNTDNPTEDPLLIATPAKEYVTQISWKPKYDILAVGTKTGAIAFYDVNLKHLMTFYTEHKAVNTLLWHPEATTEHHDTSTCEFWLAVGTNDSSVLVYDLSEIRSEVVGSPSYKVVAVLSGHSKFVQNLAWSSYEDDKLVSCGEDGVAHVWNLTTKSIVATYVSHKAEPILSALWSPLDKNYIITGGKDNSIRIWNVSEHPPMTEEDLAEVLKARWKLRAETRRNVRKDDVNDDEEPKRVKRDVMLHHTSKMQNISTPALLRDCKRLLLHKNSSKSTEPEVKEPPEEATAHSSPDANEIDVLNLFGDRKDIINLIDVEKRKHLERDKYICQQHLSLWKGDIAEAIRDAIKNETVTPWLISMAPLVSSNLWQETCEAYAKKLMEDAKSDPTEIASYLLACHKVEDAVKVLCSATLYRDALAIAKLRLSSSDPIIKDVLQKWATFSIVNGAYEIAAQCFISLDQYEEAAKALFRRTDPNLLEFAVELAEKCENKALLDAIVTRYNAFKTAEETELSSNEQTLRTKTDVLLERSMESKLLDERQAVHSNADGGNSSCTTDKTNEELCVLAEKQLQIGKSLEEEGDFQLLELCVPKPRILNGSGFAVKFERKTAHESVGDEIKESTSDECTTEAIKEATKTDSDSETSKPNKRTD